jgi:hypothetical protein
MYIYIAGPYTHPDPVVNTRNAIKAGEEIIKLGHTPYIPHLTLLWHFLEPHSVEFWYNYDLEWLDKCDLLFRLPGESWGASKEEEYARAYDIPIVYDIANIPKGG